MLRQTNRSLLLIAALAALSAPVAGMSLTTGAGLTGTSLTGASLTGARARMPSGATDTADRYLTPPAAPALVRVADNDHDEGEGEGGWRRLLAPGAHDKARHGQDALISRQGRDRDDDEGDDDDDDDGGSAVARRVGPAPAQNPLIGTPRARMN